MAGIFDAAEEAILVARSGGTTETISEAAADLLDADARTWRRAPCWEIARLKNTDGSRFCESDCPIWREARGGRLKPRRTVIVQRDGFSRPVELISIVAPPDLAGRSRVFHLMVPLPLRAADRAAPGGATSPAAGVDDSLGSPHRAPAGTLHHLSPREREILALLAAGLSTPILADRLCISTMTVRNHVKHILAKLGVHRRIDAILLWLDRADATR